MYIHILQLNSVLFFIFFKTFHELWDGVAAEVSACITM